MQPLSPRMEAALAAVIARERLLKDHNSPDPYARSSGLRGGETGGRRQTVMPAGIRNRSPRFARNAVRRITLTGPTPFAATSKRQVTPS